MEQQRKSVLMSKVALTVVGVLFMAVLYVIYLSIFPLKVLEDTNIRVVPSTVAPGGTVDYIVDYCKYVDVAGDVTLYLVSPLTVYPYSTIPTARPASCHKDAVRPVIIPLNAAPGVYHLEADIHYRLNPFHSYTHHLVTPDFTITTRP